MTPSTPEPPRPVAEAYPALQRRLRPLRRRAWALAAERSALTGGIAALVISAILAFSHLLRWLWVEWWYYLALVGMGLALGWLVGLVRPPRAFAVARLAEHRLRLRERLSSALALGASQPDDEMVGALVADAAGRLQGVRPRRLFPRRYGRRGQLFLALSLLLGCLAVLPQTPLFQSAATRAERAAMREVGRRLVRRARDLHRLPVSVQRRRLRDQVAENLKRLGKDLQRGRVERKQALLKLAKADRQLEPLRRDFTGRKSLAQAASQLQKSSAEMAQQRMGEQQQALKALKEAERLAKHPELPGQRLSPEQMKQLEKLARASPQSQAQQMLNLDSDLAAIMAQLLAKKDLQEALAILRRLASRLQKQAGPGGKPPKLTPEEMKRLAEEMRRLAKALKGTDLDRLAKQLLELAKALERGDLRMCARCAGGLGGLCVGLGGLGLGSGSGFGFGAGFGLGMSGGGVGFGPGRGPGNGMARYPGAGNINRQDAQRIPTRHYDTLVQGDLGEQGDLTAIQVLGAPDKAGKSQVPYYQVYPDYAKAAEHALDREEVPAPYRQRVKDYFESLRPGGR